MSKIFNGMRSNPPPRYHVLWLATETWYFVNDDTFDRLMFGRDERHAGSIMSDQAHMLFCAESFNSLPL
jgi:hypothetical protein